MALLGVRCSRWRLLRILDQGRKGLQVRPSAAVMQISGRHTESRILTTSTLLKQDGLEIQELPVVIRKIYGHQLPMTSSEEWNASRVRQITKGDRDFREKLKGCLTVLQVFQLLEVPSDKVTVDSAAFALQRISQLRAHSDDEIDSFIQTAILNELCDMSTKEIASLSSESVVNMVECYISSPNFGELFIERIDEEVERRVADGQFSVQELCHLVEHYSNPRGKQNVCEAVWIHLASRCQDMDETNIAQGYSILRYMSPQRRYIVGLMEKQVLKFWWKLTASDITVILKSLTLLNHACLNIMKKLDRWVFMNIHEVKENQLINILAAYIQFNVHSSHLILALEKYTCAKSPNLNPTINGMAMEYCRIMAFVSEKIFNAVAQDFEKNGHLYDHVHILYTLRPYGQLNHLPINPVGFFKKVEDVLFDKFNEFDVPGILELLASFVYLERLPINFVYRTFFENFLTRVSAIPDKETLMKAHKHLYEFHTALHIGQPKYSMPFMRQLPSSSVTVYHKYLGQSFTSAALSCPCHKALNAALTSLYGVDFYRRGKITNSYMINFEVDLAQHANNKALTTERGKQFDTAPAKRLAILVMMPEHYATDHTKTRRLLGEHAAKIRHLRKLHYTVIQIDYKEFTRQQGKFGDKIKYICKVIKSQQESQ